MVDEMDTDIRKRILKQEIDECMRALDQSKPVVITANRPNQVDTNK